MKHSEATNTKPRSTPHLSCRLDCLMFFCEVLSIPLVHSYLFYHHLYTRIFCICVKFIGESDYILPSVIFKNSRLYKRILYELILSKSRLLFGSYQRYFMYTLPFIRNRPNCSYMAHLTMFSFFFFTDAPL